MRQLAALTVLSVTFTGGCIIYDNDCRRHHDHDDDYGYGWDDPDGDPGDPDPGTGGDDTGGPGTDDPPAINWTLTPDTASPGDVLIASLTADQQVDYNAIVEVTFLSEDVQICTTQAREDELLITIGLDELAKAGPVDLVIVFADGHSELVDDALTVVTDDTTGDDTTGGDDTGGEGTDGEDDFEGEDPGDGTGEDDGTGEEPNEDGESGICG